MPTKPDPLKASQDDFVWDYGASPDGFAPESAMQAAARTPRASRSSSLGFDVPDAQPATPPRTAQTLGDITPTPAATASPAPLDERARPIQKRLADDRRIREALKAAQTAQDEFQKVWDGVEHLLDPTAALRGLVEKVASSGSAEEIIRLQNVAAGLLGDVAEAGKVRARALICDARIPLAEAIETLLVKASEVLADLMSEAEVAEEALFTGFGMKREPTGVSRRVQTAAQQVKEMLDGMRRDASAPLVVGSTPSRESFGHVFNFFAQ